MVLLVHKRTKLLYSPIYPRQQSVVASLSLVVGAIAATMCGFLYLKRSEEKQ